MKRLFSIPSVYCSSIADFFFFFIWEFSLDKGALLQVCLSWHVWAWWHQDDSLSVFLSLFEHLCSEATVLNYARWRLRRIHAPVLFFVFFWPIYSARFPRNVNAARLTASTHTAWLALCASSVAHRRPLLVFACFPCVPMERGVGGGRCLGSQRFHLFSGALKYVPINNEEGPCQQWDTDRVGTIWYCVTASYFLSHDGMPSYVRWCGPAVETIFL